MQAEKCSIETTRKDINRGFGCLEKKKKYKIITNSMSLQNMSILTQPQPWQESAGVQHTLSLDQTLKDNKADASTRQPVQQKPIASTCRYRFPCRALEKG